MMYPQIWPKKCACELEGEDGLARDHSERAQSTKMECLALALPYLKVWNRKMSSQDFSNRGILFFFPFLNLD